MLIGTYWYDLFIITFTFPITTLTLIIPSARSIYILCMI
uniref:Uncharacterized protein n=1 Tax=Rhizophora mucronata TaxID=61149 RepID=A0A2P2QZ98_RHIMU